MAFQRGIRPQPDGRCKKGMIVPTNDPGSRPTNSPQGYLRNATFGRTECDAPNQEPGAAMKAGRRGFTAITSEHLYRLGPMSVINRTAMSYSLLFWSTASPDGTTHKRYQR
jgi:hypothetical protein